MFCPNCGNKIETGQSFCRMCGMELGKSLQMLAENSSAVEKTDWLKRMGIFSIGAVVGIALTIVSVFLLSVMLRVSEEFGLFFFITVSVILWGIIAVMFFEKYKSKKLVRSEPEVKTAYLPPHQSELWKTNRQLKDSSFEPIPSVTEPTTEIFYVERIKTKTSGELG